MSKRYFLIISFALIFFFINNLFSIKIGLDSGHSIKELYKSGGSFMVMVKEPGKPEEPKPYFSIGWPAGGVKWDYISSMSKKNAYKYYVMITNSVDFPDWRYYFSLDPFSLSEKPGVTVKRDFIFKTFGFSR